MKNNNNKKQWYGVSCSDLLYISVSGDIEDVAIVHSSLDCMTIFEKETIMNIVVEHVEITSH